MFRNAHIIKQKSQSNWNRNSTCFVTFHNEHNVIIIEITVFCNVMMCTLPYGALSHNLDTEHHDNLRSYVIITILNLAIFLPHFTPSVIVSLWQLKKARRMKWKYIDYIILWLAKEHQINFKRQCSKNIHMYEKEKLLYQYTKVLCMHI